MGVYTNIQVKTVGFGGDAGVPPISEQGTFLFPQDETPMEQFSVKNVKIMGQSAGKSLGQWICDFGMEPMPANDSWTVTVTDKRITFLTRYVPSVFGGKPVQKSGKVSAGQVKIKDVDRVTVDSTKEPFLLSIYYRRCDGAGL